MTDQWNAEQPFEVEGSAIQSGEPIASDVRNKMSAPAICMVILAALGLMSCLYGLVSSLFIGPQMAQMSQQMGQAIEEEMQRIEEEQNRKAAESHSGEGEHSGLPDSASQPPGPDIQTILQFQNQLFQGIAAAGMAFSIIGLATNGLALFGALSMLNVKRYGMAITAAVLMMLPITSPCCLVGLPVGIWALVTLTRPGIAAAFRQQ